jgi:head-tail adaptor
MTVGELRHRVTLENPGEPVPDGEGGYIETWSVVGQSRMPAAIEPATVRAMERLGPGTVTATASHLVTIRYVTGVTTKTRVTFHDDVEGDRVLAVAGRHNPQEKHWALTLFCTEAVT